MEHKNQSSIETLRNYINRASENYNNILMNSHSQLKSDQQIIMSVCMGTIGFFLFYLGIQYILTFTFVMWLGFPLTVLGLAAFHGCRKVLRSALI